MRGLYLLSVWLHVLAAMTWVGGMVTFVVAVMPYLRRQDPAVSKSFIAWFGPRFRVLSWTCFTVLAITGTVNLWMRGVRLDDVLRSEWRATTFGRLLLVKLVLVAMVLAASAAHERFQSPALARWMGRSVLLLGVAIVALAVMLVRAV